MNSTNLLLLAIGAVSGVIGWSVGSGFIGRPNRRSFDPAGPRIWRLVLTAAFALLGVALGFVILTFLGAGL